MGAVAFLRRVLNTDAALLRLARTRAGSPLHSALIGMLWAASVMAERKVKKLPLVDSAGHLAGLVLGEALDHRLVLLGRLLDVRRPERLQALREPELRPRISRRQTGRLTEERQRLGRPAGAHHLQAVFARGAAEVLFKGPVEVTQVLKSDIESQVEDLHVRGLQLERGIFHP